MKQQASIPEKLFVTLGQEIEDVFRHAVRDAMLKHKKLGQSVAVWQEGQVVVLSADEIPVEAEPDLTSRLHPTQPGIE